MSQSPLYMMDFSIFPLKELKKLATKPPEGIKYVPSDEDDSIAEIHADIHGPVATPFQGGTFRMKLVLSHDFPNSPPKGCSFLLLLWRQGQS